MSTSITWVNKHDAVKIWPLVEPFLLRALTRWLPVYFSEDLLEGVQEDKMQLWIITDNEKEVLYGAALTEIREYPRAKMVNVFLLGGNNMGKWRKDLQRAIEMFAKEENCEFAQVIGRDGWNILDGAFKSAVIFNKVLTES